MWSTIASVIAAAMPVILKVLLPLIFGGTAAAQGYFVASGESSPQVGAPIILSSIIAAITSIFGGIKLDQFSDAAVLKAMTFIESAIDRASAALKDMIRQRLLQLLQSMFKDSDGDADQEAAVAFGMLGSAHARLITGQKANVSYNPAVAFRAVAPAAPVAPDAKPVAPPAPAATA